MAVLRATSPTVLPGECTSASWDSLAARQARISCTRRGFVCAAAAAATNGRPGASSSSGPGERQEYRFFEESDGGRESKSAATKDKRVGDSGPGNFGDRPYRTIPGLGKFYLDELDVITLLDPPYLSPLDPASYNHASFIWKKIGDVPEERRARLLELIHPSLMQSMWEVTGKRYDSPKLFAGDAFTLLPAPEIEEPYKKTIWHGKVGGDFWPWSWLRDITIEFFVSKDDGIYGQLSCSGLFGSVVSRYMPLYFKVQQAEFVSVTNDECDMVLDFSSGHLHLKDELPSSFRKPEKLSWPLENFVAYIRPAGPGVLVGQLWQKRSDAKEAPPLKLGKLVIVKGV
ncbi:hypothetical protein SELMODRAFT_445436 [Selaginella moellendorffii]|uniref:Uncharacterized protein n=1 Tax=Selaginella moellendorffii TaxID=88036 RepID=D8SIN7_SELML|nr:uncharacterized protein LOC9654645 [Selaginella moellendorffii]EFJ15532.1 hypothetical protein SELMODRAFT_445436 [Selaginella moellendorffii]|eukprot:XP_002983190.1 uncharacterized protein LOC9654645 [Selaginella moellendorffii]